MAVIHTPKAESKQFERKQVVRLRKGIYGGMLGRYSLPKEYTGKYGTKEKIALGFVVTHDQAYRQLAKFSGAFCLPAHNFFYDPATHKMSNLTGVVYALLGGKKSKEEIVEDGTFDWDMFIGKPVMLFIDPSETPDRDGLYANRVSGIEPADADLKKAIKPLWDAKVIETNEKTGLQYLKSPAEQYEDDAAPVVAEDVHINMDDDTDPFG